MYRKHSMEEYLMRRRLVVAPFFKSASVTAALMACPLLAQAASVQTVFSAENALYGAGYSIGQADGWIDDSLRAAVRQYQAERPGLSATGELDSPTLAALGISGSRSQLMGGNVVANQEAARKELGLTLASAPKPAPAPEPEQPAATPEPVAEPEPAVFSVAKVSKPIAKPEPQKAPEPAPKAAPEPVEKPEPKQVAQTRPEPAPTQTQSEPEPTSEPIKITSTVRTGTIDKPAAAPKVEETPEEVVNVASVGNAEKPEAATPQEPAAAGKGQETVSSGAQNESQQTDSQGNVITRVFYFLFGWIG